MRTVIVTGGACGIGRAIARRFSAEGDAVAIVDRDSERGTALAAELRERGAEVCFQECDLLDENAVHAMVQAVLARWKRIDVLVNNAGVDRPRPADQYTLEEWNWILNTNLRAAWACAKHAIPALRQSHGCIINMASIQGMACEKSIAPYASAKAGLMALTRAMALDFAGDGVRVNAVCPGAVHTGMMEKFLMLEADPQAYLRRLSDAIPLKKIAEAEDIARPVFFLASADAAYITGASLVVDGGVLARHAL